MSKFTPGPWKATHCTVSAPETEDRLGFNINVRNGNRDDTRANARLIAAAPDLLEAAKEFIRYDKDGFDEEDHAALMFLYANAIRLAKAAVLKATGSAS